MAKNNGNSLNDQVTGQSKIFNDVLQLAKKMKFQIGETNKEVMGLVDKSGKISSAQKDIVALYMQQKDLAGKLQAIEGEIAKTQKDSIKRQELLLQKKQMETDAEKEILDIMVMRARNEIEFSSGADKYKKEQIAQEQKITELKKEQSDLVTAITLAQSRGDADAEKALKGWIDDKKKEIEEWEKARKESIRRQELYRENSEKAVDKILQAEKVKEERKQLQAKEKLSPEEKKRLRALVKEENKLRSEAAQENKKEEEDEEKEKEGWVPVGSGKLAINFGDGSKSFGEYLGGVLEKAVSAAVKFLSKSLDDAVSNAVSLVTTYQQKINYRLEVIDDKSFKDIQKKVNQMVGNTGVVQQQKVIEKIGSIVDQGIAYNVEQRAFLSTIAENIQGTFDAFNSNLTRMIRIQQQDSTTARLGMEKALNDMLNAYYRDTSYLNNVFDSVSEAIFEMTANQSRDQAVETEFVVQKWLGSLYSLGASQNAIQQIATGLGYLGSGNVNALAGNQGLQSLLAISASRAGLDYAELLTSGLNGSDTNRLLEAMVKYLAEIADTTEQNKVVTSSYGNIFGLALSDIKSFQNMSSSVADIYKETMDYKSSNQYLQNQLGNYVQYMGTAQYMENMFENIKLGVGMQYSDGFGYIMYKVVDLLDNLTGGGPNIDLSYWGLGTDFHIFDLIKSGMFGLGLLGSLVSGGGGLDPNAALDLNRWGYEERVTRGTGFGLKNSGGSSYSASVGNASSSDIQSQTIKEGTEQADTVTSESGKGQEKSFDDLYDAMVFNGDKGQLSLISQTINVMDSRIQQAQVLLDEITTNSSRKAVNINLQKVAGRDITGSESDIPIKTTPDDTWKKMIVAAAVLIKYGTQLGGFGGQAIQQMIDDEANDDSITLQDFLDLFVPILESDTGVPVRIESTDSMTNLMSDLTKR